MWWKSPYRYSKLCNINTHKKNYYRCTNKFWGIDKRWPTKKNPQNLFVHLIIRCVAIFTILYGNYYPLHGEFKLICIGKFARRTWVNFSQQYEKNRQRCHQNAFYYAVWQLLLYFCREFPSKILSVYDNCILPCTQNWEVIREINPRDKPQKRQSIEFHPNQVNLWVQPAILGSLVWFTNFMFKFAISDLKDP